MRHLQLYNEGDPYKIQALAPLCSAAKRRQALNFVPISITVNMQVSHYTTFFQVLITARYELVLVCGTGSGLAKAFVLRRA